jgi:hypothetical protein
LCDKEPVEWILVQWRKGQHAKNVLAFDVQLNVQLIKEPAPQEPWVDCEIGTAQPTFYRYFPNACDTEEDLVLLIFNDCAHVAGNPF